MDRYSSFSASTAQSLPGRDNYLHAKIALFARSKGVWVSRVQYATLLLQKYRFRVPPLRCLGKKLLQIFSKFALLFLAFVHFSNVLHCSLRWQTNRFFTVVDQHWKRYRMTWNTTNWKPMFTQSSCFASILLCFTICKVHICQFLESVLRHGIHKKLRTHYQNRWCCDIFKGQCLPWLVPAKSKMLLLLTGNLHTRNSW